MATWLALRSETSRWKKSRFYLSPVKDNRQGALANHTIRSCFSLFSWRVPARSNFSRVFAAAPLHWTRRWKSTAIEALSRFRRQVNECTCCLSRGWTGECFVTGHTLNDSTGSGDKLLNGLLTETYQRSKFLSHGC